MSIQLFYKISKTDKMDKRRVFIFYWIGIVLILP